MKKNTVQGLLQIITGITGAIIIFMLPSSRQSPLFFYLFVFFLSLVGTIKIHIGWRTIKGKEVFHMLTSKMYGSKFIGIMNIVFGLIMIFIALLITFVRTRIFAG